MNRPIDENGLRDALHSALDGLPVKHIPFENITAARRRRHSYATAGAAAAVLAVTVGAAAIGLPAEPGGPVAGSGSLQVGSGPSAATPDPAPTMTPSGVPRTPWKSAPPPARPSGTPTSAAGFCPVRHASGHITYPTALDPLTAGAKAWNSPADGPPVPFTPNRAVVCRYDGRDLISAADVTDPATVARLRSAVNSAAVEWNGQECPGEFNGAYVVFTTGTRGQTFNLNVTDCFGWLQPSNYLLSAEFGQLVKQLTPARSGR